MPCASPIWIINPVYTTYKDTPFEDLHPPRIKVGCGKCPWCRKIRASNWKVRLLEESKSVGFENVFFCTMTVAPEYYDQATDNVGFLIRRFLERYRKKYGVSLRHFFVTELGEKTLRLHLHGLVFCPKDVKQLPRLWKYGYSSFSRLQSIKGIVYTLEYVYKINPLAPDAPSRVYASPGLGKSYLTDDKFLQARIVPEALTTYSFGGSFRASLPRYYFSKLFDDDAKARLLLLADEKGLDETVRVGKVKFASSSQFEDLVQGLYKKPKSMESIIAPNDDFKL